MSNDSDNLFDAVIDDVAETEKPPFRQAPPGLYRAVVRTSKEVTASTGSRGIELQLTLLEPADDAINMEGVDLARVRLYDRIYFTPNNFEISRQTLRRILPEVVGQSPRQAVDMLPGAEVFVRVKHETEDRNGQPRRIPRLVVTSYISLDYMAQQAAA